MERVALEINKAVAPLLNIKNVDYSKEHIKEEIADVMVMLKQFQLYYDIPLETPLQLLKYVPKETVDENQMKINFETGEVEQNG